MSEGSGCLSASNTLIVFDWDDTILPTTLLRDRTRAVMARTVSGMASHTSGVMDSGGSSSSPEIDEEISEEFEELASMSEKTLEVAHKCGTVCMITNGSSDWIRSSCCRYMPRLWPRLEHLRRVSAKDLVQQHSRDPLQWKKHTFSQVINEYFRGKEMEEKAKVVISIGDSLHERHALYYFFVTTCLSRVAIRSVKLVALPGMAALKAQHAALAMHLPRIAKIDLSCRTADLRYSFLVTSDQPLNDEAMEHLAEVAANEEENDFVISSLPLLDDKDADPQPLTVDIESLIYTTIKQNKSIEKSIRQAVHNTGKKRPLTTEEDDDHFYHPSLHHHQQSQLPPSLPVPTVEKQSSDSSQPQSNLQPQAAEEAQMSEGEEEEEEEEKECQGTQRGGGEEEARRQKEQRPQYGYQQVHTEKGEQVTEAVEETMLDDETKASPADRPPRITSPLPFVHPSSTTRVFPSDLLKLIKEKPGGGDAPGMTCLTESEGKVVKEQDVLCLEQCLKSDEDEEVPQEVLENHQTVHQKRPGTGAIRAPVGAEYTERAEPVSFGQKDCVEELAEPQESLIANLTIRPPPLTSTVGNFFKGASLSFSKMWGRAVNPIPSPPSEAGSLTSKCPRLPPLSSEGDSTRASTNTADPNLKSNTSFGLTPVNSSTPALRMVVKLNNGNPFLVGHVAGFAFDDTFVLNHQTT